MSIQVRNLTKRFDDLVAVNGIDMRVEEGEVLCLLGPSGCGKTTTLRMIAGLEEETAGEIEIAGRRVNEMMPSERDIAMVFQFYALYPTLTVGENIGFPLRGERISDSVIKCRVAAVAQALQLNDVFDRLPSQLSEGEKQRVAVARAVVRDPSCFLFDEPLSRLDVTLRQTMRSEIKEILNGLSRPTVIVTHDQLEALTMADRIAVMRDGIIEQIATPHQIFTKPSNFFVAGFIGTPSMNLLNGMFLAYQHGKAVFKLCGQTVTFPVDPAVGTLSPGDSVTVGIRPRAFEFLSVPGDTAISTSVDLIEPMGAETLIHATAGGEDIRCVVERSRRVAVGDNLYLAVKPNQALVFGNQERLIVNERT